MTRLARTDAALNALNDEREHLAIQVSLLGGAGDYDFKPVLAMLERRISNYRPADA